MKHYGIKKNNVYVDFGYIDTNGVFQGNCFTPKGININASLKNGIIPTELIEIPADVIKTQEAAISAKITKANLISNAYALLNKTDYKIIKLAEANLKGETMPYTIEERKALFDERAAARKVINEQEGI